MKLEAFTKSFRSEFLSLKSIATLEAVFILISLMSVVLMNWMSQVYGQVMRPGSEGLISIWLAPVQSTIITMMLVLSFLGVVGLSQTSGIPACLLAFASVVMAILGYTSESMWMLASAIAALALYSVATIRRIVIAEKFDA